jgi:MFS family permease
MSWPFITLFLSRIFYGWRMVSLVSAIRVVGGGLHQYGFTVFFLPVSQDLGLSRAASSLAFSLSRAQGAIEAPLVGYLVDRFGPRPVIVAAALLAGIGYILLSWVNSYASFLIVYLGVISLAFVAGFVHPPRVVANSWFIRQRARAMTVVSAAVPVGGALISPVLAFCMWGSFAGPVFAGAVYDRTESYAFVLWGLFAVLSGATFLNILLIKPWTQRMVVLRGEAVLSVR